MITDGAVRERSASAPTPPPAAKQPRRWFIPAVAAGIAVVVVAAGFVCASSDSDGDGLSNAEEHFGWIVADGTVHVTDPWSADTDGDGLADGDEAGARATGAHGETVYAGRSDPTREDSDVDGLDDRSETKGWRSTRGILYLTDPMEPDSDGDGLNDGQEAGAPIDSAAYEVFSDPQKTDTDADGLTDAEEADLSLDAFNADSDGDGLTDAEEVDQFGTAPDEIDTDGDGFDDAYELANRESRGLDPLWPDEQISASTYAWDFAQGAVLGELAPGDSLSWLAGNLASGASSFIPGVGWVVGSAADVRDTVGAAIHADWVGAGFSVLGLVPVGGDATAIPAKVAKFVARHPELAPSVGAAIVGLTWVPSHIKASALKAIAPEDWDYLRANGVSEASLLRLQQGRSSISTVATSAKRSGHAQRVNTPFFDSGLAGESWLEARYPPVGGVKHSQVVLSTDGCLVVCNAVARRFDVFVNGVAHESKVGRVTLTDSIERQIRSDAYLIERGVGGVESAHWHFFASGQSNSIGATQPVLDLLDELGIEYTIHLPK
ncbi:hypothetical protein J2X85_004081 [Microbacterium trichothecenolyticum]|uniref:hypothetical protein n=1 Tax=Microbacterium trichothecenolyticum TaxID=69370 RepID=UPI00285B090E|nr:hypothetical protein [Microbacterium trichothecenolyticum]MDR7187020.1 hypothetical protein [Microbacterium trichothecenolyticum]